MIGLYSGAVLKTNIDGLRLEDAGVWGDAVREPDVTTDDRVMTNGDATQDRGIGIDGDIVFDDRVARHIEHIALFVVLKALSAQGDTLIEGHMIAYDGCLANHHTRTVVDGEILTNLGSRMDIDTSLGMSQFGDDTWYHRHLKIVELMGEALDRFLKRSVDLIK